MQVRLLSMCFIRVKTVLVVVRETINWDDQSSKTDLHRNREMAESLMMQKCMISLIN